MADIKGRLVNTNVRLAALEKRNDFLAEQLMALHSSVQQMQATLPDVVNALQTASSAGSVTSSSLNLPLCTEEAYENFLRRLSVEDGFANEAMPLPNIPVLATALWRYFDGQQSGGFMDHRTGTEEDRHVGGTFVSLQKSPYLPPHAHNYPPPKNRNYQWPVEATSHPGYEGC
ncbi:hypothetical protein SprV_0301231200 [Sparganum proliferum]